MKRLLFATILLLSAEMAARAQFGSFAGTSNDANTSTGSGFYSSTTNIPANYPVANFWGTLLNLQYASNPQYTTQLGFTLANNGIYTRQQGNGAWGKWYPLVVGTGAPSQFVKADGSFDANTYLSAASAGSSFLSLTGGALKGNLNVTGNGVSKDAWGISSGNLVVQATTGGRDGVTGASLEFAIPANTDGSNIWGQARIITVSGSPGSGNATGKLILGTRRWFNKVGTATWNYGDDITIDGSGNVGIGTTAPRSKLEVVGTGTFSPSATSSSIVLDGSALPQDNNWSNVRLIAGGAGGSGYLTTKIDDGGGYFNWTRGSSGADVEIMRLNATNGFIGIGTTNPRTRLEVYEGDLAVTGSGGATNALITTNGTNAYFSNGSMSNGIAVTQSGSVQIGNVAALPQPPAIPYLLNVAGNVRANKLVVNTSGADFVFGPSYKLSPLAEVENYVKQNRHLPGIAPATDMQRDGVEVGEQQAKLLQKMEELTLYIIGMEKEIDELKKQLPRK